MTHWVRYSKQLRDNDEEATEEKLRQADDWEQGLSSHAPDRYLDANGVPCDSILRWLDLQFVDAMFDGDYELAYNTARMFLARSSELQNDDTGESFRSESLMWLREEQDNVPGDPRECSQRHDNADASEPTHPKP